MKKTLLFLLCGGVFLLLPMSCEKKGPAEKVGKEIDDLIDAVEDAAEANQR